MLAPSVWKYNYVSCLGKWLNLTLVGGPAKRDNVPAPTGGNLSDRKYRQHGYQDSGQSSQKRDDSERLSRPVKKDTFGPRAIQMPGTRTVSRCSQCGTLLAIAQRTGRPVSQVRLRTSLLQAVHVLRYLEPF